MRITQKHRRYFLAFVFLHAVLSFMAMNKNSRTNLYTYQSEIFSDKAGYYVYFPAMFIHDWDTKQFPEDIIRKTGEGFKLDNGKVFTKYPCGVALLQLPFQLIAHWGTLIFQPELADGFTKAYHKAINLAASFYAAIGFLFLYAFLSYYFDRKAILISLSFLFLGTNLLFYTIRDTGMSHIYALALFACFLYLIKKRYCSWLYIKARVDARFGRRLYCIGEADEYHFPIIDFIA